MSAHETIRRSPASLLSRFPSSALPLLLALLVAGAGCSSGPLVRNAPDLGAPADFPNHTAEQVVGRMALVAEHDALVAFSSQARLEIRSPERDATVSATIRQRAADTLWASVRGPLGIEVARVRATPDSFAVLDKLNDRLYLGAVADAADYLPTPTDTRDLFDNLLGALRPDPGAAWSLRADAEYYYLTDPVSERVFTVDPASWRTVRYQGFEGGVLVDERTFSAFDEIDGRIVPRRIELRNPRAATRLTIEQRQITLNPAALAFPFSPGDADVHRLD